MQEAHRKGGEEALMCNYRGELSECSQSNFFLVRDGVALTPQSASGLLVGLTRGFLFEVGRDVGVRVEEATLRPEDLATAQEAFITGSTRELTPVVRIDDQVGWHRAPWPGDACASGRLPEEGLGAERPAGHNALAPNS